MLISCIHIIRKSGLLGSAALPIPMPLLSGTVFVILFNP